MKLAMVRLYCGESGQKGFYNLQELGLAKALNKMDIDVYIITLSKKVKKVIQEKDESGVILLTVPARGMANHGYFNCSILSDLEIDVVHLQSDNQIFAPYVMRYCYKNGINCYNYVGTLFSDSNNLLKSLIMSIFSKWNIKCYKNGLVFAKTPNVQKQLIDAGVRNVKIAPVGLDTEIIPQIEEPKNKLRKKLGIPQDKKVLIFVGRLEEYKKPLEAIDLINELDNDHYLLLIGKGTLKEDMLSKITTLELDKKIRYIEAVPNKEIHEYYKASDYFINLNNKEIFGMSILEAMYQGCTVVAVKSPGPSYIIEDGVSGYLVSNEKEMIDAIYKRHTIHPLASHKRIVECFTWEKTAEIVYSVL
ncbi:glycosyltransferase [Bacillus sp. UNC41MFS5]|uniref:glycosyltransferase n=1 Tax=Bacillus sp. UNC41MFS5 TaxID=1449046 RepID=UPI000479464C|nr:glycosyltransferase [Bacillus sp. UNC41MFS5]